MNDSMNQSISANLKIATKSGFRPIGLHFSFPLIVDQSVTFIIE